MTPALSILSPRPGTEISGARTFHVQVRDTTVTEIAIDVDGTTVCTDTEINDGVSDACILDINGWSAGEHIVTIQSTTPAAVYTVDAPYLRP